MSRFAHGQPDLFPLSWGDNHEPVLAPLDELAELLRQLRTADRLPWPDLPAALDAEMRVVTLAKMAGPEGQELASAIFDQTERLFSSAEQV